MKKPLDKDAISRIYQATFGAGSMVRVSGSNVIISPTLILPDADCAAILSALDKGLDAA